MVRSIFSILLFYFLPPLHLFSQVQVQNCSTIELENNRVQVQVNVDGILRKMDVSFCDFSSIYSDFIGSKDANFDIRVSCNFLGLVALKKQKITPLDICSSKKIGVIGLDNMQRNSDATHLNFDKMTICAVSEKEGLNLLNQGYRETKSIFYRNKVEIVVSINWQDYKFTFDLNYDGTFSHPFVEKLKLGKDFKINYDVITVPSNTVEDVITIFPFTKVYLNKIGYSASLTLDNNSDARVGIGFLKGFNWIIDHKKKKIYCKKNNNAIDSNVSANDYKSRIIIDEITVVQVKHNSKKYVLGSVITSVSGVLVSSSTICELQNILDRTFNWDVLELTFRQ